MKKLFAIMLCALLAVCAVVPSFAATQLSSTTPTDPFVEAEVITCNFEDYMDDQPQLFNNVEYWAEKNGPDYSQAGFYPDSMGRGWITLWGGSTAEKAQVIWQDLPTFQVKFNAPVAGDYSFAFTMSGTQKGNYYVPIRVDDGEWYHVAFTSCGATTPNTYYGMDNIHLEAGEHVFHFSKAVDCMDTQYYYGFQYTYVADETAEDTSAEDTTTAAPAEDTTTAAPAPETPAAPATFDAAVIALAVAGASAAVAVVAKKRR